MYGAAFVFKFVTRFICVETILAVMPRKKLAVGCNSNTKGGAITSAQMKKKSKKIQ